MTKILSKFGEQQLVMVNYACGFKKEGKNSRKHVELIGYWDIRFLFFFFFSFGPLEELLFEERLVLDKPLLKMKINKLPLESTIEQATVTISLTPQNNSNC